MFFCQEELEGVNIFIYVSYFAMRKLRIFLC